MRHVLLSAVLLATVACNGDDPAPPAHAAPWELGGDAVAARFGPFHRFATRPIAGDPVVPGWQAVLLPAGHPVAAYNEVVRDAQRNGFEAGAALGGPCWQEWGREEAPLGEDLQGRAAIGEPLPDGATTTATRCAAIAVRDDVSVEISVHAVVGSPNAILVTTTDRSPVERDAVQEPVPEVPTKLRPTVPQGHLELLGLAEGRFELAESVLLPLFRDSAADSGMCQVLLLRTDLAAARAVAEVVSGSRFGEMGVLRSKSKPLAVAGRGGVVFGETITADGGTLVVSAVEVDDGSEILLCKARF